MGESVSEAGSSIAAASTNTILGGTKPDLQHMLEDAGESCGHTGKSLPYITLTFNKRGGKKVSAQNIRHLSAVEAATSPCVANTPTSASFVVTNDDDLEMLPHPEGGE